MLARFRAIEHLLRKLAVEVGGVARGVVAEHGLALHRCFRVADGLTDLGLEHEVAKVLFLNNAINHGVLAPLGVIDAAKNGRAIHFLLETNPGPGLGLLLAFAAFGKGAAKLSAPGAIIIHFFGGIHEIYFPYVLSNPIMIVAMWAGGITADIIFVATNAGLVATPSPGSIFAYLAVTPPGQHFGVFLGSSPPRSTKPRPTPPNNGRCRRPHPRSLLHDACPPAGRQRPAGGRDREGVVMVVKRADEVKLVVFVCEAGMGSSLIGANQLKKKIKDAGLDVRVIHSPVNEIPTETDVVVAHEGLADRARKVAPTAVVLTFKNFMNNTASDRLLRGLVAGEEISAEAGKAS